MWLREQPTHIWSLPPATAVCRCSRSPSTRADASYRPTVTPRVVIGNDMCLNAETVSSMGTRKTTDSRQYVAGVNGDFFITASFAGNHEFGTPSWAIPT